MAEVAGGGELNRALLGRRDGAHAIDARGRSDGASADTSVALRLMRRARGQASPRVRPKRTTDGWVRFRERNRVDSGERRAEGLGNQFLGDIRETDANPHVVRCVENSDVVHVEGRVDPAGDIDVIHLELALADFVTVTRNLERAVKAAKTGRKEDLQRRDLLAQVADHLDQGLPVRSMPLDDAQRDLIRHLPLLTAKPTLYIANVAEDAFQNNPFLDTVSIIAVAEGAEVVAVCAAIEAETSQLEEADKGEFLAELGFAEPRLDQVIRAGYRLLGLQTYFTVGPKEVRAWTVRIGATAPEAAGEAHTDFQRGFIRAEVIPHADFIACGGESEAKEAGKMGVEGKEHVVRDGDVMHCRFNV